MENREIVRDVGEISWAEKLKNYSQTQGGVSPVVVSHYMNVRMYSFIELLQC